MQTILDIWPTVRALAGEVKVPYTTAASWRQNGMIPARYDARLVEAAKARGVPLTLADIAEARAATFEAKGAA